MKIRIFLILLLTCFAGALQAQRQEVHWDTMGVDLGQKAVISLGDQLNLVCTLSFPNGTTPLLPSLEQYSQGDLLALRQSIDTTLNKDGSTTLRQVVVMTCFALGEHSLSAPFPPSTDTLGGDSTLLTLSVLDIPNVDTTKAEIKDIGKNFSEPYTFWEIFRWVLLALLLAALGWVVIHYLRRRQQHEPVAPIPQTPPVPVDQKALQNLEKLRTKELWQHGMVKEYHTELTDIVREYLRDEYAIESAEMTSDQTLESYRGCRGWSQQSDELLRRILRTADMVKFAKHEPPTYEHDISLSNAISFVKDNAQLRPQGEHNQEEEHHA